MRDSEQKLEWLFINLRWFLLLAVASVIALDVSLRDVGFPKAALILLVVGGVANLTALIVLLQNASTRPIRDVLLLLDILITIGFIASTRHQQSQLLFISLVPITIAALQISWASGIAITAGMILAYWLLTWFQSGFFWSESPAQVTLSLLPHITNGAVLAIAGVAISWVGKRIEQSLIIEREVRDRKANQALQVAHQRASLVFELASTLSATLNYERVLEAALDISHAGLRDFFAEELELSQVGMILLFGMDQTLYVAKARGLAPREEQLRFSDEGSILARGLSSSEPLLTDAPSDDPELSRIHRFQESQQVIVLPLRAGYENYGLLVLGSSEPDVYTPDFCDLLVAICNQAVLALQNASLYQNLMEDKDRLVTVEEDARKKLARDLHDGPTQTIAAIAMRLNYIRLLVDQAPLEAVKELRQLEELARRTTKEIRQMLFTLRPLILESQGLVAALEQLTAKVAETSALPLHLQADRSVDGLLSKDARGAIFYIVEEATANARKHSQADNIWIRLYQQGMHVIAEVEDDGIGFDVAEMESNYASRGSLGMINLRERATLVRGKTIISSIPAQGTKITVNVPVDPPREAAVNVEGTEAKG